MVGKCKCTDCKCKKMTTEQVVEMIEDQTLPFTEEVIDENTTIRRFSPEFPEHLYKWHSDEEDRIIQVLEDSDWRFQYDNELPIPLLIGIDIKIPKGVIHRIIKGTKSLTLKINKLI